MSSTQSDRLNEGPAELAPEIAYFGSLAEGKYKTWTTNHPPRAAALRSFEPVPGHEVRAFVIDFRGWDNRLDHDLLQAIAERRSGLLNWVLDKDAGDVPPSAIPIVLICATQGMVRDLRTWATVTLGVPSFWFAAGIEVLVVDERETRIDVLAEQKLRPLVDGVDRAMHRLHQHPLLADGPRARELFAKSDMKPESESTGGLKLPAIRGLQYEYELPTAELRIVLPGTYQLKGGLSVPLDRDLIDDVLLYVVTRLTATKSGNPSGGTGYTLLEGHGLWFNDEAQRFVEEPVRLALTHLHYGEKYDPKVERPDEAKLTEGERKARYRIRQEKSHQDLRTQMNEVARYLRFAWLQDVVFVTLDGVPV